MIKKYIYKFAELVGLVVRKNLPTNEKSTEVSLMAMGRLLTNQQLLIHSQNINDYEFKIFSEWGDDGIIQYLIRNIYIENDIFIEFGVENYMESNTRFLMMNNNWSGFILDGSLEAMKYIRNKEFFWRYTLVEKAAWIDKENINALMDSTESKNIGILSIDIDGNDYFIFKELNLTKLNPSIIIVEYNSVFGKERKITVPYDKSFNRTKAHYSNLFFGASLSALNEVAEQKGYSLVCCNLAGNNAYFVRNDLFNDKVQKRSVDDAYKISKFRDSRDESYNLSFVTGEMRLKIMKGLSVLNIETNQLEYL